MCRSGGEIATTLCLAQGVVYLTTVNLKGIKMKGVAKYFPADAMDRFMRKVKKHKYGWKNGCWEWMGYKQEKGYGFFRFAKSMYRSHRFIYEALHGPIPKGAFICHTCDRPWCVNPDHLFLGDAQINNTDKKNKGRCSSLAAEKNPAAKITGKEVRAIREFIDRNPVGYTDFLAGWFGISTSAIGRIKRKEIWKKV